MIDLPTPGPRKTFIIVASSRRSYLASRRPTPLLLAGAQPSSAGCCCYASRHAAALFFHGNAWSCSAQYFASRPDTACQTSSATCCSNALRSRPSAADQGLTRPHTTGGVFWYFLPTAPRCPTPPSPDRASPPPYRSRSSPAYRNPEHDVPSQPRSCCYRSRPWPKRSAATTRTPPLTGPTSSRACGPPPFYAAPATTSAPEPPRSATCRAIGREH